MKKNVLVWAVLFAILFSPCAFAEEWNDNSQGGQGGDRQGMGGGGQGGGQRGGGGMNPMMMMGMMNKPSMLATSDGGVIVLAGPRLAKYDKDLNLVKEVELKKPEPKNDGQQQNEPPPQQ